MASTTTNPDRPHPRSVFSPVNGFIAEGLPLVLGVGRDLDRSTGLACFLKQASTHS